jgi:hypothetical protein
MDASMLRTACAAGFVLWSSMAACSASTTDAAASDDEGAAGDTGQTGGASGLGRDGGTGGSTAAGGQTGKGGAAGGGGATTDGSAGAGGAASKNLVFLLIGQSNMEGLPQPEAQDKVEDPNVKVLAYDDCSNVGAGRTYNQWYSASPPLHSCYAGVGPGDYFGKTLIKGLPAGYTVSLVPLGVSGAGIDLFRKGVTYAKRSSFVLPPDDHWAGGYEWIISRAKEAQKVGVLRGIIFHQGESDTGDTSWPGKVQGLVSDLRADLGMAADAPFLAGELPYTGCCGQWHNPLINQLPGKIPGAFVVSAKDLTVMDAATLNAHFDLASQRTFGARYGATMLANLKVP